MRIWDRRGCRIVAGTRVDSSRECGYGCECRRVMHVFVDICGYVVDVE